MTKEKSNMKIEGTTCHLPSVRFQPIAAEDVASAVATVAMGSPLNGTAELGGPQQLPFDEFIRRVLRASNDSRSVIADPHARYFGAELSEYSLVPGKDALLGEIRFEDWLSNSSQPTAVAAASGP